MKRLILCADDYALAPGVSRTIRDLSAGGRLNATSVMAPGPDLATEAERLLSRSWPAGLPDRAPYDAHREAHAPHTAPRIAFAECISARCWCGPTRPPRPAGHRRRDRCADGRLPVGLRPCADFVDGHQHAHLLPASAISCVALVGGRHRAPGSASAPARAGAGEGLKGRVIAGLSRGLKRLAARHGIPTNPAFSGAYDFRPRRFRRALPPLPRGSPGRLGGHGPSRRGG